jgi:predicted hotdog family 3-hydroxylacyl-ACP dehydratase
MIELRIDAVLPHQGHMRLLDELLELGADSIVTAVTIRPDGLFHEDGQGVPAWVGMEYMAQTACAFSGAEQVQCGEAPDIALLLGTRQYVAHVPYFPTGARLIVAARLVLRGENNLSAFHCTIHHEGRELANGDIKAIRPDNLDLLIA